MILCNATVCMCVGVCTTVCTCVCTHPLSIVLFSTEGEEEEVWLKQLGLETIVSRIKGELGQGCMEKGQG